MAKKDIKFTLDTIDSRYSPVGTVKQLDSVFLYIKITENGVTKDLTGQTIKLFAIKEDKKIVEQTTKINITNQREGLVEIELLNAALQVHGFTYFELEISDSNGIISTSDFILRVNKRVGSDEAIESTNEVATLKKIEEYVAQAKVELQKLKELQTEMLKTNETINSQESLRVSAEAERVNSESARVVAEDGRVAAETKREEAFNKFEGKIDANLRELTQARTATTGEQFNSLDERIDCEVDRINKKIEISFLEQVDRENHEIKNTIEGMTTDTIIKGKTLQNLFKIKSASDIDTKLICLNQLDCLQQANEKYTLINNTNLPIEYQIVHKDTSLYKDTIGIEANSIKVYTLKENEIISRCEGLKKVGWASDKFETLKKTCFILVGDWSNKTIPRHFEGIKSHGEKENNEISILSTGENLFNYKTMYSSWWINAYGALFKDESETKYSLLIPLYNLNELHLSTPNKDRCTVGFLSENDTVLAYHVLNEYDIKVTTPKPPLGTKKALIYLKSNGYDANKDNGIMVSYSDVEFKPYQQNKKDISLSKYGFDEGLRGINNTLYDELNEVKNKAVKRIEKYTFTGNENIERRIMVEESKTIGFGIKVSSLENLKIGGKCISNNFKYAEPDNCWNADKECISISDFLHFRIDKTKLTTQDVEGFKTWLKANQTTIFYELAEPVEIPLTENINLKTYDERTYIRFENALSGTSSFKVPVNAAATISRLNRENKALEEENLSLRQDLETTTLTLTDSDLALVKQNVDMDFRLMEVEFALDIPQAILSSNIKFKNKKGEVKSMARTPYEMMKIVILSGDYDREDYMHKVGKYYERGRMTKEEHDELMSLITADEVLSK